MRRVLPAPLFVELSGLAELSLFIEPVGGGVGFVGAIGAGGGGGGGVMVVAGGGGGGGGACCASTLPANRRVPAATTESSGL